MKKIRIAALVLALIMLTLTMAACQASPKVSVNCKVSILVNGEYRLNGYAYTVEGTEANPPTVLQACVEAFRLVNVDSALDENGTEIQALAIDGVTYAGGNDGTNYNFWEYTVNGELPQPGETAKAGNNPVKEGDEICYMFSSIPLE